MRKLEIIIIVWVDKGPLFCLYNYCEMAADRKIDGFMVEELKVERERSRLNLEELAELIYGGEMLEKRRKMANLVVNDPVFKQDDKYFLSSEEAFDNAMRKNVHFIQVTKELNVNDYASSHLLKWAINEELPASLHESMFITTIKVQLDLCVLCVCDVNP
jgi:hypothetical protein